MPPACCLLLPFLSVLFRALHRETAIAGDTWPEPTFAEHGPPEVTTMSHQDSLLARQVADTIMELISADRHENYQAARRLLLGHDDTIAFDVLAFVTVRLRGDYYRCNARECSYFLQHLVEGLVAQLPEREELLLLASEQQLRYGNSGNAVHWTREVLCAAASALPTRVLAVLAEWPANPSDRSVRAAPPVRQSKDTMPYAVELLDDQNPSVRQAAVRTLGEFRDLTAFDRLLPLVQDPDDAVRLDCLDALFSINESRSARVAQTLASDPSTPVQLRSAQVMGLTRDLSSLPVLSETLILAHDAIVRTHAAKSIGLIRPVVPPPELIRAIADPDPGVRGMSAWALGEIGSEDSLGSLQRATADANPFVAWSALKAVRRILVGKSETAQSLSSSQLR